jgi:hypothetical protein
MLRPYGEFVWAQGSQSQSGWLSKACLARRMA